MSLMLTLRYVNNVHSLKGTTVSDEIKRHKVRVLLDVQELFKAITSLTNEI